MRRRKGENPTPAAKEKDATEKDTTEKEQLLA